LSASWLYKYTVFINKKQVVLPHHSAILPLTQSKGLVAHHGHFSEVVLALEALQETY